MAMISASLNNGILKTQNFSCKKEQKGLYTSTWKFLDKSLHINKLFLIYIKDKIIWYNVTTNLIHAASFISS